MMTWNELKKEVNKLTPKQLKMEVLIYDCYDDNFYDIFTSNKGKLDITQNSQYLKDGHPTVSVERISM